MFRNKTVFVVGAGASKEFQFPIGSELLKAIGRSLDIRFDHFEQASGSHTIMQAFKRYNQAVTAGGDVNDYLRASWRLRGAAAIARSIDNAMHQNSDDPKVEVAGKFSIAEEILKAERKSTLYVDPRRGENLSVAKGEGTWLYHFGQILTTDVNRVNVDAIFDNVEIITFNYDRSIEHYLPSVLTSAYGLTIPEAREVVGRLRIHHAYGQVGRLPWSNGAASAIDFGGEPRHHLERIAEGIQTFTESRAPEEADPLRHAMASAEYLVFLGFGFHRPNMDLLCPESGIQARLVLGTTYAEPKPAREVAYELINQLYEPSPAPDGVHIELLDCQCADFMQQHYSLLSL